MGSYKIDASYESYDSGTDDHYKEPGYPDHVKTAAPYQNLKWYDQSTIQPEIVTEALNQTTIAPETESDVPGIAIFFFIFMGIYFIIFTAVLIYKYCESKRSKNKSPKPGPLFGQPAQSSAPVYTVTTERIKPTAPLAQMPQLHPVPKKDQNAPYGLVGKSLSPKDISNPIPIKTAPWVTPATPYHTPSAGMPYPAEAPRHHPAAAYASESLPSYDNVLIYDQKK
ncbi:uncharacterized protein [Chironomus tepperi]|uniref:uncharacterized protein n=1 Tax=Chironomus tepperi TaxID=113505 RepID=UPI00391F8C21